MPQPKQVKPHTMGAKEIVLRGRAHPADGGQSKRQVNQIISENHQLIVKK